MSILTVEKIHYRIPSYNLYAAWIASAELQWQCVADPIGVPDEDTTFVYINGNAGLKEIYGMEKFAVPVSATIIGVTVTTRSRRIPAYGNSGIGEMLRIGGTDYNTTVRNVGDTYENNATVWAVNPATGIAWTSKAVNAIQGFGILKNNTGETRCTACYIEVAFTIPYRVWRGFTGALSRLFQGRRQLIGSLTMSGALLTRTFEARAIYVMGANLYALIGTKFYKIDSAWTKTLLGSVGTTTGKAWIVGDGTNLCVVDSVKGYSWNGATWAEITFPDAFAPSSLTFQDGYYIVSKSATGRFYISALLNPTSWNALDYATAEGAHDNLVVVHSHNRDLWLLGTDSLEVWYNSGASTFPFERYAGGFINIGCKAARSVVSSEQGVFWMDNHGQVRMGLGVQSVIISTPQIEYQISLMGQLSEAVGFYYFQKGHGFYQLSIGDVGLSRTFVFDTTTKYWHTRATGVQQRRHPAQCYAFFNNKHLVGHYLRGQILELDFNSYTNDGDPFTAIRAAQAVHADRKRIFHKQLEIEFESGVGVDVDTDATAILNWSDDGARTWSNDHIATFGKLGEYTKRAIWRRLGNSRGRVYRVTIDDPVKRVILGAHLEAEPGRD